MFRTSNFKQLELYPEGLQPDGSYILRTEYGSEQDMKRMIDDWFEEARQVNSLKFKIKVLGKRK